MRFILIGGTQLLVLEVVGSIQRDHLSETLQTLFYFLDLSHKQTTKVEVCSVASSYYFLNLIQIWRLLLDHEKEIRKLVRTKKIKW